MFVTPTPNTLVFLLVLKEFSIDPLVKKILWNLFLFKNISWILAIVPFAVGFVVESCKTVVASNLETSPSRDSTTIISERDQSELDAKIVLSNGLITSINLPYKTLKRIFKEESVPFEL